MVSINVTVGDSDSVIESDANVAITFDIDVIIEAKK